jgi:hypothetical protein
LKGHLPSAFKRRAAHYAELDSELSPLTSFFAAAALTNEVLAQFFSLMCRISRPHSYYFLSELGEMLQEANLHYASALDRSTPRGEPLDRHWVRSEQMLVQRHLDAFRARAGVNWQSVHRELNDLLNQRHVTSPFSAWFESSRQYDCALSKTRREIGEPLDFVNEYHRFRIGMELVRHISANRRRLTSKCARPDSIAGRQEGGKRPLAPHQHARAGGIS